MQASNKSCHFCIKPGVYAPLDNIVVCEICANRVGQLAVDSPRVFWELDAAVNDDLDPNQTGRSFSQAFQDFDKSVVASLPDADVTSHLNLATAYTELGMYASAVGKAAAALRNANDIKEFTEALKMLLATPLLEANGLERLVNRLRSDS